MSSDHDPSERPAERPAERPRDPAREPGRDDTAVLGEGLGPVEDRLRRSLRADADAVEPTQRLDAVLAAAHATAEPPATPRRGWLMPLVAAAAVALVAVGVWATQRPGTTPVPGASTATSSTTSAPTVGPSTGASSVPTGTATTTVPPATQEASVPVYYVGHLVPGSADLRLVREFVPTRVPAPADAEARALAALGLAMGPAPDASGYVRAWDGVRALAVSLDDPARIALELSSGLPDASGVDGDLAVQQLVWTVQAAVAKGTLPVVLTVDGGGDVAPGIPSGSTRNRPTDPVEVYGVLSPLWIDEPYRGQTLPAGSAVAVKGVASTFEANVEWQLLRGGSAVAQGATTASAGAPDRGTYTFRTDPLQAGDYVLRVLESSAKDGSVAAEQRMPFTVR